MTDNLFFLKKTYLKELRSYFGYEQSYKISIESAKEIEELKSVRKEIIAKQAEALRMATRKLFIEANIKDKSLLERIEITMKYKKLWELYVIAYRKINNIPSPKTQRRNARKKALSGGTAVVAITLLTADNNQTSKSIKPIYTPIGGQNKR